jgi:prepilin-type N-terminal cleavage/methylation domain-containing protein
MIYPPIFHLYRNSRKNHIIGHASPSNDQKPIGVSLCRPFREIPNSSNWRSRPWFTKDAFSLPEILLTLAIVSLLATMAASNLFTVRATVAHTKLRTDVARLNRIITIYRAEGGSVAGLTDPQAILDKLKTRLTSGDARRHVGLMTGRAVDIRLVVRLQTSSEIDSLSPRAIWNPATEQFDISTVSGQPGVASFDLDDSLAVRNYGTESRVRSAMLFNGSNGWIWEVGPDRSPGYLVPSVIPLASPAPTPQFDPLAPPPSAPPPPVFAGTMTPSWINPLGEPTLVQSIDNSDPSSVVFIHGSSAPRLASGTGNIPVQDFSFESPTNATVKGPLLIGVNNGALGAWSYSITTLLGLGSASVSFGSSSRFSPSNGAQMAKLKAPTLAGVIGKIELNQVLTDVPLSPYTTYTLMFDMAGTTNLLELLSSVGASITLSGTKVASLSSASLLDLLVKPDTMTPVRLSFTTDGAPKGALGIDFTMTNLANALGATLYLDNLQLYAGSASSMVFRRATFSSTPNVNFDLGQLLVHDGVTFDHSSASRVTLHLLITMTSPRSQTIPVDLNFAIDSSASGVSGDAAVTLTNPVTSAAMTVGEDTYILKVALSTADSANGAVTDDAITVYPGKTVAVQLKGTWIRN